MVNLEKNNIKLRDVFVANSSNLLESIKKLGNFFDIHIYIFIRPKISN